MKLLINELEKEILKELVNISLAKAADAFAVIAKEKVLISAPSLDVVDLDKISTAVPEYENYTVVIESSLQGVLTGKTFLLFSEEQSDRLAEICLGTLKIKKDASYIALTHSLLLEIGNIITGSLVTQLSNLLKVQMFGSVPELKNDPGAIIKTLHKEFGTYRPFVFTVKTQFVSSLRALEMPFLLILDVDAFTKMLDIIRTYNANNQDLLKYK